MSPPVRVLVDDDPMVRTLVRRIIGTDPTLEVVGEATDGAAALDEVIAHHPDVVLMDLTMPGTDGVAATRAIRARPSPPAVLVLTTWDLDTSVDAALQAGADGYLLKTAEPAEILASVHAVAAGHGAISPSVQPGVLRRIRDAGGDRRREARAALATLTGRELEVALLVARGDGNAEIARRLHLGETTVKSHLSSVQAKLGATNRTQVAVVVDRAEPEAR
ncbi:response regulator [Georgenia sp. Z1344]|uniref:response regulator n=1 Tax=Georgenia sp. Z1344 TaxID=3416706 RepID=UPI003CEA4BFC